MRPKAILFDMDGTLLPMDQNVFMKHYFGEMAKVLAPLGLAPEAVAPTIWAGTKAMMKNTGETTNDEVFWQVFTQVSGLDAAPFRPVTDAFYSNQFHRARAATAENPLAVEAVRVAREKAEKVVLATNPLFPMVGQKSRMGWVGLKPEDFDLVTSYETDRYCKPNPAYFRDVCRRIGVEPDQCVMIGNGHSRLLPGDGLPHRRRGRLGRPTGHFRGDGGVAAGPVKTETNSTFFHKKHLQDR